MKRAIPLLFSLLNATMGALAVYTTLSHHSLRLAYSLILLGIVFDGLDGHLARMLKVESRSGALIDSLSDIVTFSLAPSALIYVHLYRPGEVSFHSLHNALVVTATYFLFIFSLYRLIRYYREYGEVEKARGFSGLPAPAAAFFVVSLLVTLVDFGSLEGYEGFYLITVIAVTPIMVTRIYYLRPGNLQKALFIATAAIYFLSPEKYAGYIALLLLALSTLYLTSPLFWKLKRLEWTLN